MLFFRQIALVVCLAPTALSFEKHIDFDQTVDFTRYKTFKVKRGTITAKAPELSGAIVQGRIDTAIRQQLAAKRLEEGKRPDLFIEWRFGAATTKQVHSWPTGRFGMGNVRTTSVSTEGTLVIDIIDAATDELVWRGINREGKSKPADISRRLEKEIKDLLDKYPPKPKP